MKEEKLYHKQVYVVFEQHLIKVREFHIIRRNPSFNIHHQARHIEFNKNSLRVHNKNAYQKSAVACCSRTSLQLADVISIGLPSNLSLLCPVNATSTPFDYI